MKNNTIHHLTCAAFALLSLTEESYAGRIEETYNTDFQYGHYSENNNRIDVDIFEGSISSPIGKNITASVNLVKDVISGASPIQNKKNLKGGITQIVSGASQNALKSDCGYSICERRDAITPSLTYFFDNSSVGLSGGFSRENDYTSRYVSSNLSVDINKKLTTLNFAGSVAFDEIQPTNLSIDCSPKCSKTGQQYLVGISQIINKDSLIQSNFTFSYNTGYLSDPYKRVEFYTGNGFEWEGVIWDTTKTDTRPRTKFQWAWLTQYVRHFGTLNNAALHIDYRFTTDTWGTNSHTTEWSWHQPIGHGWQVIPRFRYYSQDASDFYAPYFEGNPDAYRYYSSDYRLAGFGALSGGIKISKEFSELKPFHHLKLQAGFEYYDRKSSYELGSSGQGNFADFSYYLITASINLRF